MFEELVKKLRYCGNAVSCLHCPYWEGCAGSKEDLVEAADAIEKAMTKRKTGVWIGEGDGYADGNMVYDMWSCGCCGTRFDEWEDKPTWKYCPVCGSYNGGNYDD